jgi:hypothetical protein
MHRSQAIWRLPPRQSSRQRRFQTCVCLALEVKHASSSHLVSGAILSSRWIGRLLPSWPCFCHGVFQIELGNHRKVRLLCRGLQPYTPDSAFRWNTKCFPSLSQYSPAALRALTLVSFPIGTTVEGTVTPAMAAAAIMPATVWPIFASITNSRSAHLLRKRMPGRRQNASYSR